MSQDKTIVVWSLTGCSQCQEVKAYLEDKGYAYATIDVAGKEYLREVLQAKYNTRYVPVIEIGANQVFEAVLEIDYNRIEALLVEAKSTVI